MGLKVWLPLNGNLENKGASGVKLIQKTAPTYINNGKIGKALSAGAFTISAEDTASILNNDEISFCFWIYPNAETGDTTNRAMIFGNGGMTAPNNRKFSIFQYPTCNDLHLSWQNDVTNTTFLGGIWNGVFPSYTWTHCAITYSKTQGKATIYINGEQYSTANGVSNSPSFEFETYLMSNGGTFRYLNDYRIYDHCLSPKEVKEISQGLVLHYKLDSIYNSSPKIWSLSSYSRTADLTTSNTYIYSIPTKTVYLTPGKQYTVGAEVRVNQNNISFYFDSNCTDENGVYSGNDAAQTVQYNPSVALQKNEWIPVWITTTIKADAGRPYYHHGFLFKTTSGTVTTLCEIRNVQIYEGAEKLQARPFDVNNIIADSSGYGNNGTIVGTLAAQQDSPRYGISTSFAASSAINCGRGAMVTDSITVNLWAKYSSYSNLVSCTEGGGWNFENNSGLTFPVYVASVGYVHIDAANRPPVANYANSWHMFTGVYDRLNKLTKLYIDGELIGTGAVSSPNLIQYHTSNVIWLNAEATGSNETASYGNAKSFSDFRIYATALSAEDILNLYNTPTWIDKNNSWHTHEFYETMQGRELMGGEPFTNNYGNHNYLTSPFTNYNEKGEMTFTGNSHAGSNYIKINPTGHTYYYDIEISVDADNQFYLGFHRYDVDKTSRSNNACVYVINVKPTTTLNHQRYFGIVNLATDGVNPTDTISLRILNDWTNANNRHATIHYLSLREVDGTMNANPEITKNGLIKTDTFRQWDDDEARVYKNGFIGGNNLIEI